MQKFFLLLCFLFVTSEVACRGGGRAGGGRFGGRGRAGGSFGGGRSSPSRPRGQAGWFSSTQGRIFSGSKDKRQWEDSFSNVNKRIQSNRIRTNFGTKLRPTFTAKFRTNFEKKIQNNSGRSLELNSE